MGWADGDMNLLRQCAETVLRVAKQILADLTPGTPQPDIDDGAEPAGDCVEEPVAPTGVLADQELVR